MEDWKVLYASKLMTADEAVRQIPDGSRVFFGHAANEPPVLVDALVRDGVQGLVVACTGNGTIHHALEAALLRAQAGGVRVLRSTRCAQGQVLPKPGDALPDARGLPPVKARISLMLELLQG